MALGLLLALCAGAAGACGNTVQDQPIPHNALETLVLAPYPVYWLGRSFRGMAVTEAARDPSGAFSVQYGDCLQGGQGTCVPPLRVVTSPDNSFVPGASSPHRTASIRGAPAVVAQRGRAIAIPTGGVVVAIYALTSRLAAAAAQDCRPQQVRELVGQHEGAARREGAGTLADPGGLVRPVVEGRGADHQVVGAVAGGKPLGRSPHEVQPLIRRR